MTLLAFKILRDSSKKKIWKVRNVLFSTTNVNEVFVGYQFEVVSLQTTRNKKKAINHKRNWSSIITFIMTPKAELLKIDQNLFCVGVHLDYLRLFISHPIVFTVSFILITIYDDGIYLWAKVNLWESATMRKVGK